MRTKTSSLLIILSGAIIALLLALVGFTLLSTPASARPARLRLVPVVLAAPGAPTGLAQPDTIEGVSAPAAAPTAPAQQVDRPALTHHTPDYNVAAPPSVSAALIERVLTEYKSPAQGTGAAFYDLGLKYGIDPAYALAFYIHESAAGTKGVARFTKSIGNIRTTPGYKDYEGYRSYGSYEDGIEDWYKLIHDLYINDWGLRTPDKILERYAPWTDNNNPVTYAVHVEQLVDGWQEK